MKNKIQFRFAKLPIIVFFVRRMSLVILRTFVHQINSQTDRTGYNLIITRFQFIFHVYMTKIISDEIMTLSICDPDIIEFESCGK